MEAELPGFRFHPTEEELLEFYLKQQAVHGKKKLKFDIIPTVQLYRHEPWELPGMARIVGDREWYFFVPRDRPTTKQLQAGGGRPSRTTERGFWKATGSDRAVRCAADPKRLIGLKKTLVYYEGRAPRGTKTDWVMNEYRLPDDTTIIGGSSSSIVLCKIYRKAVSLKELEQRVAMEELNASATATPSSASHDNSTTAGSISSSSSEPQHQQVMTTTEMKTEEGMVAVARPATLSLPQLEIAARPSEHQVGSEWMMMMQDPFLTQLRSPWMEACWSPAYYYGSSVLNF